MRAKTASNAKTVRAESVVGEMRERLPGMRSVTSLRAAMTTHAIRTVKIRTRSGVVILSKPVKPARQAPAKAIATAAATKATVSSQGFARGRTAFSEG